MKGALRAAVVLLALLLLAPAAAAASGTTTTSATTGTQPAGTSTQPTTTTPTTTTPVKPKAPAKVPSGSAKLFLPGIFVVHGNAVTVSGRRAQVEGVVRPFVPGQWVEIRAVVGRRLIKRDRLRIKPSANHSYGTFVEKLASPRAGEVVVYASHDRTSAQGSFTAKRAFQALDPQAGPGSTGRFVQLVQQRLAALHFYIPQTGVYDNGTELAIDAYHRLLGWGTYKTLDGRTISFLLNGWGQFKVRFPSHGRHAEGNLAKQLLALVDGSKVELIFPISSGKPSTPTILGDFHIYERTPGYLPDGMYYSDFFIRGYAIHGYDPAPDYPASHGCMRLPIPDAITAYNWLAIGDWVDVYY
jgi:L,D-transpeptidase catalytic domain